MILKLSELKEHLRVDFDDDDFYILGLMELVEELVLTEIQGSIDGEGTVETALTPVTGTVETDGTVALVGTDSNFRDFTVGETITVSGETIRTIATITDNTHLTVSVAFDTTDNDLSYVVSTKKLLIGTGTYFTNFKPGDTIKIEGETIRTIDTITDDTHLTVTTSFAATKTGLTYIMYPGIPTPLPKGLKQAMLLFADHFYMLRGVTIIGVTANEIPYSLKYLFAPFKHYTIR